MGHWEIDKVKKKLDRSQKLSPIIFISNYFYGYLKGFLEFIYFKIYNYIKIF